ncbi:MAG: class I SAM-dependent methyltransferase [Fimbriimonadales bacterium]|nr:class I SAM-dependent methyltransferase [Fimbriimonadales bacterium]MDW8052234.1 class I SAM-dependent methyltransferase [Armatimonadota bacterium]
MTGSSASEAFEAIAPYYDLLMQSIPYLWWMHYVETLLEHFDRSAHKVLDLCCGTGNLSELFALSGYEVVGVDKSPAMIEQARRKAEASRSGVRYYVQDAAELALNETFDLIVSLFDSLNYITEPSRFAEAMRRAYQHLTSTGLFIFDLNTEYAFVHKLFDQSQLEPKAPLRYRWRSRYDKSTRLCTVEMEFWVREGNTERYFTEIHRQRAYSEAEVRQMLYAAGFAEVHTFDAYTLDPPTRRSDRVFYVALR